MEIELRLRLILEGPPSGVDFALQQGKGNDYQMIQKQRSKVGDLVFEFAVTVKDNREDGLPNFLGPLTQGPPTGRFVYLDIGKIAGQTDSPWERRLKAPLSGIGWPEIKRVTADPKLILEARFPGTAKDGGPSCATVKPKRGWVVVKA